MASAVGKELEELCTNYEQMELDGVATGEVYTQLLAIYLLQNDICNAKFLWKRMPDDIKNSTPEAASLWTLGCHMWKRDYVGIYASLNQEWSSLTQPYIISLKGREKFQDKVFRLCERAYTSIKKDDLAAYLGMTVTDAVSVAVSQGWTLDSASGFLAPKRSEPVTKDIPLTSEQELALLTDYVSFLEN
ncbi:predicted protein [Nematostella vectensis]|uniref:CSN8/PSMD8/EIF3K domain-containing protein n=1 Tax=Nematostella vectensis TaxID=45351 RepID=A7SG97_NEMVE|nr:predicted protein [Nematostella vectensis]|eukprot:XP_001629361.1 predicted protein [Nematostella vectensis]